MDMFRLAASVEIGTLENLETAVEMDWQEILLVSQSFRRYFGNCGAVACHQQIQQVSPQLRFLG
jgi:hypothetical protein